MMSRLGSVIRRFVQEEEGATLVEYALAIGLISLVAGAGALILGQGISSFFSNTTRSACSTTPFTDMGNR